MLRPYTVAMLAAFLKDEATLHRGMIFASGV